MAYAKPGDESQVALWDNVVRKPEAAAYAFNALLRIDPYSNRIERTLKWLWVKQLAEAWAVDTAFLMRRAARARGSEEIISHVLGALYRQHRVLPDGRPLWDALDRLLHKRDWSKAWTARAKTPDTLLLPVTERAGPADQDQLGARLITRQSGRVAPDSYGQVFELYIHVRDFRTRSALNRLLEEMVETYPIRWHDVSGYLQARRGA